MRKIEEKANSYLIVEQDEPFVPSKGWAEMIKTDLRMESILSLLVWRIRETYSSFPVIDFAFWDVILSF